MTRQPIMHRTRMRSLLPKIARTAALLAVALGVMLPAAASAQTGTTTGAIRGRVSDEANNPMPAAQVTATNVETGLARSAQSDDQGVYTIRLLPPGVYRVNVRRLGSQPAQLDNIRVLLSQTAPANVVLRTASVTLSAVQVTAEAQVDVADAGVKTHVSQEEIENLPTLGRDFTDFINLSGAVSPTPEATTGGQFAIAGQRPSQTNIQIDGVDANNAYFGENRGGSRVPFTFSLESIREFQIVTNGYDVEYGNYSGGIVNIVTRGGTNEFKGTAYANYRDESLTARNFNGTPVAEFTAAQYAASVEGPIIKDKLHYLVSVDGQQRNEPFSSWSPGNLRASGFRSDSALADSLERFIDILENDYGVSNAGGGFGEFTTTDDVITLFGRLDWSINEKHRLSLRNNFNSHKNANETFSGAIRGGRSTAETIRDKNNSFVGELTSEFGSTLFNTLRVQYATEARPRTPNDNLPSLRVNLTPSEQLTYGGNSIAFRNNLDEDKFQVVNNLTWLRGDHSIKIGTNNTFSFIQQTFWRNGTGIYTFGSLEDLENFEPNAFERSIRADRATPGSKFDVQEMSGYLQDDWQVTPKLLASLGLRYDVMRIGDRPGRVVDAERAFGIETGIAPVDNDNISPRVSFTYDLLGDATHVVRAGGGLFYGRIPYVLANNVAATEVPTFALVCRGAIENDFGVPDPDAPPDISGYAGWSRSGDENPFTCRGGAGIGGLPEYAFWNGDFEMPETIKANLGYETRFRERTSAKLDLTFTGTRKLYTVRNANLRDPQFVLESEGNRFMFQPRNSGFDPSSSTPSPNRLRNTDFTDVFVNYNDGVARSVSGTLELGHQFVNNTSLRGSYTYTWAKDNSSFSCCTSFSGFTDEAYGQYGPNYIGTVGEEEAGWGPSEHERRHVLVFSGIARLPFGIRATGIWRMQSGTPWGPEISGDLNADGVRFNDRPFIFSPEELPVFVAPSVTDPVSRDSIVASQRLLYARNLSQYDCVGDYVGKIIPRNTCRQPWFNKLDVSLRKDIPTVSGQSAELSLDLFNVLNGLNREWGEYETVTTTARNILVPRAYDPVTNRILYEAGQTFGSRREAGTNLLLQFSAQLGVRYRF